MITENKHQFKRPIYDKQKSRETVSFVTYSTKKGLGPHYVKYGLSVLSAFFSILSNLTLWLFSTMTSIYPMVVSDRGVPKKVLHGEAPHLSPTPYPFSAEKVPFRISSINKWLPFHIPGSKLCIP